MVSSTNYSISITQGHASAINASIPVRFNQKKEEDEKIIVVPDAKIKFHKIKEHEKHIVQGVWPDDYVIKTSVAVSSKEIEKNMELMSRYRLIKFNLPSKKEIVHLRGCYQIDNIVAPQRYHGAGTKALQSLLDRSVSDKDTDGRIIVYADIVDGQTSPAGFFYKLGFRFLDNGMNEVMETWLRKNIKTDFPKLTGVMYLPKSNINKLMMYGRNLL